MKTKLVLLLLFAFIFSGKMYCQFSMGGKAGLNVSNVDLPGSMENPFMRVGLNAGLVGTYSFNERIDGQVELLYSMQGV